MKTKIISIVAALSLMSAPSFAQWHLQQASPNSFITGLQIFGTDTLYATTQFTEGILLKSVNGGTSLDSFTFPNVSMLKQHFINGNVGFVAGRHANAGGNAAFKTLDGGSSWQTVNIEMDLGIFHHNIHFIDAQNGFISAQDTLYRTTDGGNSFSSQTLIAEQGYISGIHFLNAQVGFVSLVRLYTDGEIYRDMIFKTTDGGTTWINVFSQESPGQLLFVYPGITEMQFINSQIGYAVAGGAPSKLLKSIDGGTTWNTIPTTFLSDHIGISDVHFVTEQIGYAATGLGVYKTNDAGANWHLQNLHPQGDYVVANIAMVNADMGYLSGHGIFKTQNGGGTLTVKPNVNQNLGIEIYPNPTLGTLNIKVPNDIELSSATIIDASGRIIKEIPKAFSNLDLQGFAKGNYWLLLQTNKGMSSLPFVIK